MSKARVLRKKLSSVPGGGEAVRLEERATLEEECTNILNRSAWAPLLCKAKTKQARALLLMLCPTCVPSAPLGGRAVSVRPEPECLGLEQPLRSRGRPGKGAGAGLVFRRGGLGEQAGRQAFTAASFPPGGSWLCALNLTSDDLCVLLLKTVPLPGAVDFRLGLSFSIKVGNLSQPETGFCSSKSLPIT